MTTLLALYRRPEGGADALARIGDRENADALFVEVLETSTLSETQYNYACFLADAGRAGFTAMASTSRRRAGSSAATVFAGACCSRSKVLAATSG